MQHVFSRKDLLHPHFQVSPMKIIKYIDENNIPIHMKVFSRSFLSATIVATNDKINKRENTKIIAFSLPSIIQNAFLYSLKPISNTKNITNNIDKSINNQYIG